MQKPPVKKEPLIVRAIGGIFVGIPFGLAKSILIYLTGQNKPWLEKTVLGTLGFFSLFCIVKLGPLFDLLDLLFQSKAVDPAWESGVKFSFFFLIYLAITLPVFLCFAYLNQETRLFKQDGVKRDYSGPGKLGQKIA